MSAQPAGASIRRRGRSVLARLAEGDAATYDRSASVRADVELTAHRGQAILHVGDARARGRRAVEAGAVVAHLESEGAVLSQGDGDRSRIARVLRGVLQCLEAAEVDRALHVLRVAGNAVRSHTRRDRGPQRRGTNRLGEPPVREQRREDTMSERPDLVEGLPHLLTQLMQLLQSLLRVPLHRLLQQLELNAQGNEPLLRPVMQIALDPSPLTIRTCQDAGP